MRWHQSILVCFVADMDERPNAITMTVKDMTGEMKIVIDRMVRCAPSTRHTGEANQAINQEWQTADLTAVHVLDISPLIFSSPIPITSLRPRMTSSSSTRGSAPSTPSCRRQSRAGRAHSCSCHSCVPSQPRSSPLWCDFSCSSATHCSLFASNVLHGPRAILLPDNLLDCRHPNGM